MIFGTTVEHALRALTHMAAIPKDEAILGRDLAKSANIPANYLSKILWSLGNAGIIDATRGSGGGYKLRKPPAEIRLIEIVGLLEPGHVKSGCLLGDDKDCSDTDPCPAHAAWREVRAAHLSFLNNTTIADIARPSRSRAKKATANKVQGRSRHS